MPGQLPESDRAVVEFRPYLLRWIEEPTLDIELVDHLDDGLPLALADQGFAFNGEELIGPADRWAIEVTRE